MYRMPSIRFLAIVGILSASAAASVGTVWAQSPPPKVDENQLRIRAVRFGAAGTLRIVQDLEPAEPEPKQPEPIGPGVVQGNGSAVPPSATGGQGSYEHVDSDWKPIGAVSASITLPAGELPADLAAPRFARAGVTVAPVNHDQNWPVFSYSWEASAVGHNPLYFEDVNLERYGYSHGILQPWISGGRFFLTVIFLPYKIVAHPPHEIIYPLGYARPGDPATPVREIEPIKLSAAAVEAAFVVGMIVILP